MNSKPPYNGCFSRISPPKRILCLSRTRAILLNLTPIHITNRMLVAWSSIQSACWSILIVSSWYRCILVWAQRGTERTRGDGSFETKVNRRRDKNSLATTNGFTNGPSELVWMAENSPFVDPHPRIYCPRLWFWPWYVLISAHVSPFVSSLQVSRRCFPWHERSTRMLMWSTMSLQSRCSNYDDVSQAKDRPVVGVSSWLGLVVYSRWWWWGSLDVFRCFSGHRWMFSVPSGVCIWTFQRY